MKKILSLVLLLSLFSCDKDEPNILSAKHSKEEIFNAVVGTWKFSRLGYDPEFKKIENVTYEECGRNNYTIFGKDSSLICIRDCGRDELVEKGTFNILIYNNDVRIQTENSGAILVPDVRFSNSLPLYNFTDSTLIFSGITYRSLQGDITNMYSELKRVK